MPQMNKQPLVSILMTVYNREKYIAFAIDSVLASTYKNWELIIVDDQSKDKSVEIAKQYASKDQRIKFYINNENLGDYLNRNKAASYADGEYLKYLDADDLLYPYGLEQLVFYMEQFPDAGYGLCSLDQDKERIFPFQLSPDEAYRRHYFHTSLFHKAPLSSMIKRKAFEIINGFSGRQHLGDFELWHRLSQKFPVVLMPHGIAWYREHDDQQMNDNRTDPFVPFKYLLFQREILKDQQCPISKIEINIILGKLKPRIAKSVLSGFRRYSIQKGMQLYKKSDMNLGNILYYGIFQRW